MLRKISEVQLVSGHQGHLISERRTAACRLGRAEVLPRRSQTAGQRSCEGVGSHAHAKFLSMGRSRLHMACSSVISSGAASSTRSSGSLTLATLERLLYIWLLAKRGSDHASLLSVMSVSDLCVWSSKQWSLLELLFCLYVHQRPSLLCIPKNVGFSTTKDLLCHILLWIPNEARPSVRSLSWWTSFLQNFPFQMKWKKQPSTQQGKAKRSKRHNLWHNASQKQVISQVPASSWERSTNINPHLIRTNLDTSYFDSFLFKPRLLNNVVKMLASLGERESQHFEKRIDRVRVSPHACALHKNLIPVQFNSWAKMATVTNLFTEIYFSFWKIYYYYLNYCLRWVLDTCSTFTPSWRRFKRLTSWSKSSLNRSWCRAMIQSHEHPN